MSSTTSQRKASQKYREAHREEVLKQGLDYLNSPHGSNVRREYRLKNQVKERARDRTRNAELLDKVLDQYHRKCNLCGFDKDARILQLDHVNGNGNQERRRIGVRGVRKRALEQPNEYQLLCPNCNWIKRFDENEHNPRKD